MKKLKKPGSKGKRESKTLESLTIDLSLKTIEVEELKLHAVNSYIFLTVAEELLKYHKAHLKETGVLTEFYQKYPRAEKVEEILLKENIMDPFEKRDMTIHDIIEGQLKQFAYYTELANSKFWDSTPYPSPLVPFYGSATDLKSIMKDLEAIGKIKGGES